MENCTNRHHLPDKPAKDDWTETCFKNICDSIDFGIQCGYNLNYSYKLAVSQSCAGPAVLKMVKKHYKLND